VIGVILLQVRRPSKYIVSDEHRFVYFVVQKVACSSIKTALLPLFGLEGTGLVREDRTTSVHRLLAESHHELTRKEFLEDLRSGRYDGYFKFAFVRNPWDRLVSCYLQKAGPGARENTVARRLDRLGVAEGGFRAFAEVVCAIPDERANPHFRSQHVGLTFDDRLLPDFVGRFENLEGDFAPVAAKIAAPNLRLSHLTPLPRREQRHYRDFYDDELACAVGERYRRDVELFRYSF
jgi:chondroitin 4-sulfotransferase 11